ncbi:MAG TPA: PIN domain nuclease, partial [Anaerolineales bacterium]
MSTEFFLRIIFMLILGILGGIWGHDISKATPAQILPYTAGFALLGALVGLLYTPYFTTRPVRTIRGLLGRMSAETLLAGISGLIVGLVIATLLAFPLSNLPAPFGSVLPFIGVVLFSYFGVSLFVMRQGDIMSLLGSLSGRSSGGSSSSWTNLNRTILL